MALKRINKVRVATRVPVAMLTLNSDMWRTGIDRPRT